MNVTFPRYIVELVILRSQQVKAHHDLQYIRTQRQALIRKASPLDPRLNRILDKVDAEVARCEGALKSAIQPMTPRIDYLSGVSDVAPPHDILYPDGDPTPDPPAIVSWAERETNSMRKIIDKLKAEMLLDVPTPASSPRGHNVDESSVDRTSAKRKRLDDDPSTPSSAPALLRDSRTEPPQLSIEGLPTAIADLAADVDDLVNVQLENIERETLASISRRIQSFRQSAAANTLNSEQDSSNAHLAKLKLEQRGKEWSDATEREMGLLDEVIKKKERRNERMKDMNAQLLAKIEKVRYISPLQTPVLLTMFLAMAQCERDLEESRVLLTALVSSVTPEPLTSTAAGATLLKNPYFIQLMVPLQQELREVAIDTLCTLLTTTWEGLEKETLAASERTSQRLWVALRENVQASEMLLKVIGLGSD